MAFKVGDKVRTTKNVDGAGGVVFPVGTIGVVIEVDTADWDGLPYEVKAGDITYWYAEDMLEYEKTYEQGLADAWGLARKITGMGNDRRDAVFGYPTIPRVMETHTAEEALAKMAEYEKLQIKRDNIVEDNEGTRALVLDVLDGNCFNVFTENGCVEKWHRDGIVAVVDHTIDVSELAKRIGER